MREEIVAMRLETREDNAALRQEINGMTSSMPAATNRGNDRYERTGQEIDQLKSCVSNLENPAA